MSAPGPLGLDTLHILWILFWEGLGGVDVDVGGQTGVDGIGERGRGWGLYVYVTVHVFISLRSAMRRGPFHWLKDSGRVRQAVCASTACACT